MVDETQKVSIIVPLYNGERYIKETILRILNSSYKNLEIVVVDDGSIDNGAKICRDIQKNDSRVLIYSKTNGGIADARNYGVTKATGDYLCFCDQDDYVEPLMYEKMVERMQMDKSEICFCSTGRYIDGKKTEFEINGNCVVEGEKVYSELLYPMIFHGYIVPFEMSDKKRYPSIWNHMYKRTFWDRYGFRFRVYVCFEDDILINVDTLSNKPRVSLVDYIGYYWRVNLKSESYAHRFVKGLFEKQKAYQDDMMKCLTRTNFVQENLDIMYQILRNKQWLEAVHILTSPQAPSGRKEIQEYFEAAVFTDDFVWCNKCYKRVKKGYVKARVILPLISKRMVYQSLIMERFLNRILIFSLKSSFLIRMEKKMKR
mgnify:CR=1 FL=1